MQNTTRINQHALVASVSDSASASDSCKSVVRKPRRKQRPLTFDNRDGTATADRLNYFVIVPFCSVECKPKTMDDYARALGKLSVNARRVYHVAIALSGMGENVLHRLRAGEIAARTHISESSAQRAIKELKRAGFIEEVELEDDGNGKRYFECSEPGHRHGDSSIHYVSPGERPVRIGLHPLHESRKCVCGPAGRVCKVPSWYFALGGVSPWVAEVALYQAGFGGIGKTSFAQKKHLSEHVMVGKSERHIGRVLKELDRFGAERTERVRQPTVIRLPANPPEGIATLRDDCATPARVNSVLAVRKQSACNLHESQVSSMAVRGVQHGSQGCPASQSGVSSLEDCIEDCIEDGLEDVLADGSPSTTPRVLNSDSHADPNLTMEPESDDEFLADYDPNLTMEPESDDEFLVDYAALMEQRPIAADFKMTATQVEELVALCEKTGADPVKLLVFYEAKTFETMTGEQYAAAKFGMENRVARDFVDALVSLGVKFTEKPDGGLAYTIPAGVSCPTIDPRYRDRVRRLVAERGLCRVG